ncbi:MAG: hypothetical protein WC792_02465 [Candidatus Micrarchaeia archaeon]|jgi:hypothetical protein
MASKSKTTAKPRVRANAKPVVSARRLYKSAPAGRRLPFPLLAAVAAAVAYGSYKLANAFAALLLPGALSSTGYVVSALGSAVFACFYLTLASLLWKRKRSAYAFAIALAGTMLVLECLLFLNLPSILPLFGLSTGGMLLQLYYAAGAFGITLQAVILWGVQASKSALEH